MLLALWSAYSFEEGPAPPVVDTTPRGGALNRWYAYDLPQKQAEKLDEFVEEYVEELKQEAHQTVAAQTAIAPIVLKEINALDLLGTAIIQEAIRQAQFEYQEYRARELRKKNAVRLMLLLN